MSPEAQVVPPGKKRRCWGLNHAKGAVCPSSNVSPFDTRVPPAPAFRQDLLCSHLTARDAVPRVCCSCASGNGSQLRAPNRNLAPADTRAIASTQRTIPGQVRARETFVKFAGDNPRGEMFKCRYLQRVPAFQAAAGTVPDVCKRTHRLHCR